MTLTDEGRAEQDAQMARAFTNEERLDEARIALFHTWASGRRYLPTLTELAEVIGLDKRTLYHYRMGKPMSAATQDALTRLIEGTT